jgi:hypothetical protein
VKRLRAALRRECPDAFGKLVELWCYTGLHHPADGVYENGDELELAIEWAGKPGVFADALVSARLVDALPHGRLAIHDWSEHNEYASHDAERSERQRLNAHKKHCVGNAECDKPYCPQFAEPVAERPAASGSEVAEPDRAVRSAPVPSPVPSPVERKRMRASSIAEPFVPSEDVKSWAAEKYPQIDFAEEVANFIDRHTAKGSTFKDWDAALRTWIRNAAKWSPQTTGRGKQSPGARPRVTPPSDITRRLMERNSAASPRATD